MRTKKYLKWVAPAIKAISTIMIVILLAVLVKETSPFPYLIVSVCTLIPFALILVKKVLKLAMPLWVDFCVLVFTIMAADLGSALGLYDKIGCYDLIVHGLFGGLCSMIMLYFWRRFVGERPNLFGLICIFLITMGFAALWECWEFTVDLIFHRGAQGGLNDTMTDILIAAAGALLFYVLYFIDKKTHGKLFCLNAEGEKDEKGD